MNVRNLDRTQYLVRDPSDWHGAAFVYQTAQEAFEHWREDQSCDVFELNPIEGYCLSLKDDFEEWAGEAEVEAASLRSHERSYRVPV